MTLGANLEFGLGGDLSDGKPWQGFARWLLELRDEVRAYDIITEIDFLEGCVGAQDAAIAADLGMPYRQFTDLYVVGGGCDRPDALETLKQNIDRALAMKTVTALNMQVYGDREKPSLDDLAAFYHAAEALSQAAGITLFTETHIDRFTYDPRRLLAVHERLLQDSKGAYGLRIGADFSHYVHQLDNPHGTNWNDISSGELNINPFDPKNLISRGIINTGMIGYGHLRTAVPNQLPRGHGSIQYPLVDPATQVDGSGKGLNLRIGGPWNLNRTAAWKELYRQTFYYQLSHPQKTVARFSSEFIECEGEYKVDAYSNRHQNIAALCWAQALKQELVGELSTPVKTMSAAR